MSRNIHYLKFIDLLKETIVYGKHPNLTQEEHNATFSHGRVTNNVLEEKVVVWNKTETIIITYATENVASDLLNHIEYITEIMPFDYEMKIFFHGFFSVDNTLVLRYGGQFASPFRAKLYDPLSIESFTKELDKENDSSILEKWFETYLEAMHDGENHSNMKPIKITNIGIFLRKLPNV